MPTETRKPLLITDTEAAKMLSLEKVSVGKTDQQRLENARLTVLRMVRRGELAGRRVGRRVLIFPESVEKFARAVVE